MTTITQLPDLCTSTIFKGIPLAQLITNLSRVCTNWTTLQRVELGYRKRLVLGCDGRLEVDLNDLIESVQKINNQYGSELIEKVEDDDGKPWASVLSRREIEFNLIRVFSGDRVYTMTEDFTTTLLDNLKGLTHLTVVLNLHYLFKQSANTSLTQLARIIDHYATSLVSLKLDINYYEPTREPLGVPVDHPFDYDEPLDDEPLDDEPMGDDLVDEEEPSEENEIEIEVQALFDAINRIQKQLNHVSLNIVMPSAQLSDRSFAFLERVHSFKTDHFVIGNDPEELLLATLAQHATGGACSHIEIGTCLEFRKLIQLDRQLAAKFRRLVVSPGDEGRELVERWEAEDARYELLNRNMQSFGNRFTSLRSLELLDLYMPMTKIALYLSRLTELIHLKIDSQFEVEINNQPGGQLVITPLPSVRLLVLDVYGWNHLDIERLRLGEIFPNLQVLRYESMHSLCDECDLGRVVDETSSQRKVRINIMGTCVRLTLQSLPRLIPSMRLVQYAPGVNEQEENTLHVGLFNLEQLTQLVDVPMQ